MVVGGESLILVTLLRGSEAVISALVESASRRERFVEVGLGPRHMYAMHRDKVCEHLPGLAGLSLQVGLCVGLIAVNDEYFLMVCW